MISLEWYRDILFKWLKIGSLKQYQTLDKFQTIGFSHGSQMQIIKLAE
jgi:hypothetical protein